MILQCNWLSLVECWVFKVGLWDSQYFFMSCIRVHKRKQLRGFVQGQVCISGYD